MFVRLGEAYIEDSEVCAVYPAEPEVDDVCVVLMKNGHMLEVETTPAEALTAIAAAQAYDKAANLACGAISSHRLDRAR